MSSPLTDYLVQSTVKLRIHKTAFIEFEFYVLVYEFNMFLAWLTESF